MRKQFDNRLKRVTYEIIAGEYLATKDRDAVLITLLGSCVAVCMLDEINQVVGMNHFMLPGKFLEDQPIPVNDPRYGTCAIDMLVLDMVKAGAQRDNLKAKIFGGGNVVEQVTMDIAGSNAEFTRRYLAALKIPVIAEDLGGNWGRKLYFFTHSHEVFLKKITDYNAAPQAVLRERQFLEWMQNSAQK